MLSAVTSYHKPTTVDEAQRLARRRGEHAAFLAGGTALLARRDAQVTSLVDLGGLGLDYIRQGADKRGARRLEIGAMTTLQTLTTSPVLAAFAGGLLATAAHDTATRTVRNAATIGGSIAACGPATDVVVALLALVGEVLAASGRVLTVEDILANRWPSRHPRLHREIHLYNLFSTYQSAFCRVARLPSDQAIVNVAAVVRMDGDVCVDIRLAAGGVAEKPERLRITEAMLINTRLDEASLEKAAGMAMEMVDPPADILGSSEYRRAMLGVLLRRAVEQCWGQESGQ